MSVRRSTANGLGEGKPKRQAMPGGAPMKSGAKKKGGCGCASVQVRSARRGRALPKKARKRKTAVQVRSARRGRILPKKTRRKRRAK